MNSQLCKFKNEAQKTSYATIQNEVIYAIRFPLILLVVLFHLYEPGVRYNYSSIACNEISMLIGANGIAKIAVPAFFLISGYLFFFNIRTWNLDTYKSKLTRRCRSLLIPYILWNAAPIVCIIIVRLIIAIVSNYSPLEYISEYLDSIGWFSAFWGGVDGHPYVVPLWYVRDLMVCSVLSPIIYLAIRGLGGVYIALLGFCFLTNTWFDLTGFSVRAWFFFSSGAFLSINKMSLTHFFKTGNILALVVFFALWIITSIYPQVFGRYNSIACNVFIIFGIYAIFNMVSYTIMVCKNSLPKIFTTSVFFIFAFHVFPLPGIGSVLAFVKNSLNALLPDILIFEFIEIILSPILIIAICIIVFRVFRKVAPQLCCIMNGERVTNASL